MKLYISKVIPKGLRIFWPENYKFLTYFAKLSLEEHKKNTDYLGKIFKWWWLECDLFYRNKCTFQKIAILISAINPL